jgi:hypothetical protein
VKNTARSWLIVIVSIVVIIGLAVADISDNGMLTTGVSGMLVLILGTLIIPTILELKKQKSKTK